MIIATNNLSGYINAVLTQAYLKATADQLRFIPPTLEKEKVIHDLLASQIEPIRDLMYNARPIWIVGVWFTKGDLEWARDKKKRSLWYLVDHHKGSVNFDPSGIFHKAYIDPENTTATLLWDIYQKSHDKPNRNLSEWATIADMKDRSKKTADFMKVLEPALAEMAEKNPALLISMIHHRNPQDFLKKIIEKES